MPVEFRIHQSSSVQVLDSAIDQREKQIHLQRDATFVRILDQCCAYDPDEQSESAPMPPPVKRQPDTLHGERRVQERNTFISRSLASATIHASASGEICAGSLAKIAFPAKTKTFFVILGVQLPPPVRFRHTTRTPAGDTHDAQHLPPFLREPFAACFLPDKIRSSDIN